MRILFMGTPDFAVPSLQILIQHGYDIVAVITATDKTGGRGGKQLLQSAVKKYAIEQGLHILQPPNLKAPEFVAQLRALQADLAVVVAFRMLPEVVWSIPSIGTFNLHGSLLPKYRGAAPINWAVINGEIETGVTTFFIRQDIDTGDVILQQKLPILPDETAGQLHDRMMLLGADTVLRTVQLIKSGNYTLQKQDEAAATKAPKIFHETCQIKFDQPTQDVYNFVRGLSPYPGAWTKWNDEEVKIFMTEPVAISPTHQPAQIHTDGKSFLHIATDDGYIAVLELQVQGRRKMSVRDFLNGFGRSIMA